MKPNTTIIGAGIIGMSAAAFLQRAGHDVTVIDRVGPGEGCSFGNAGGVAFAEIMPTVHPRIFSKLPGWLLDPLGPLTIRWRYLPKALPWFLAAARNVSPRRVEEIVQARAALGLRVVADFETLLGDAGRTDLLVYRETLRLFDDESQFAAEAAERETKKRLGFPCEIYTGDQVREMEPAVGRNVIRGASHGGWYFVTNPEQVVKAMAARVAANGGTIMADDVRGIVHQDGVVTALTLASGGRHPVQNLVVCAGAYSHLLARQLGEHVLLEAERGYHIVLPDPGVSVSRSLTRSNRSGFSFSVPFFLCSAISLAIT